MTGGGWEKVQFKDLLRDEEGSPTGLLNLQAQHIYEQNCEILYVCALMKHAFKAEFVTPVSWKVPSGCWRSCRQTDYWTPDGTFELARVPNLRKMLSLVLQYLQYVASYRTPTRSITCSKFAAPVSLKRVPSGRVGSIRRHLWQYLLALRLVRPVRAVVLPVAPLALQGALGSAAPTQPMSRAGEF